MQNGQPVYYVWYEFYPHWSYTVNTVTIHPGDVISAEVSANAKGTFTVTLTDQTTGKGFQTSAKMNNANRSSAELIAEAPWSGGVLPLANFGTALFGSRYTPVPDTSSVTMKIGSSPVPDTSGDLTQTVLKSPWSTRMEPQRRSRANFQKMVQVFQLGGSVQARKAD